MTTAKTYTDIDGKTLPIPPLEELRVKDWASLSHDRYAAVEAWWIHADHPGFGRNAEHTVQCMREAGFSEAEIRDVLAGMFLTNGEEPTPAALTNAVAQTLDKEWCEEFHKGPVQSDSQLVIEHYRRLVGALLEHSWIDHEGTEVALADFMNSDDRAADVLQQIRALQELVRKEGTA